MKGLYQIAIFPANVDLNTIEDPIAYAKSSGAFCHEQENFITDRGYTALLGLDTTYRGASNSLKSINLAYKEGGLDPAVDWRRFSNQVDFFAGNRVAGSATLTPTYIADSNQSWYLSWTSSAVSGSPLLFNLVFVGFTASTTLSVQLPVVSMIELTNPVEVAVGMQLYVKYTVNAPFSVSGNQPRSGLDALLLHLSGRKSTTTGWLDRDSTLARGVYYMRAPKHPELIDRVPAGNTSQRYATVLRQGYTINNGSFKQGHTYVGGASYTALSTQHSFWPVVINVAPGLFNGYVQSGSTLDYGNGSPRGDRHIPILSWSRTPSEVRTSRQFHHGAGDYGIISVNVSYPPASNGTGSYSGTPDSATDDFYQLRMRVAKDGDASGITPEVVTFSGNTVNVTQDWDNTSNVGSIQTCRFSTTNQLPTPLVEGQDYFVIYDTPTAIRLAASESDAAASIPIVLGGSGLGVHTLERTSTARYYLEWSPMAIVMHYDSLMWPSTIQGIPFRPESGPTASSFYVGGDEVTQDARDFGMVYTWAESYGDYLYYGFNLNAKKESPGSAPKADKTLVCRWTMSTIETAKELLYLEKCAMGRKIGSNLFLCCYDGLRILDLTTDTVTHHLTQANSGLPSDGCVDVRDDHVTGKIWVAGPNHITILDPASNFAIVDSFDISAEAVKPQANQFHVQAGFCLWTNLFLDGATTTNSTTYQVKAIDSAGTGSVLTIPWAGSGSDNLTGYASGCALKSVLIYRDPNAVLTSNPVIYTVAVNSNVLLSVYVFTKSTFDRSTEAITRDSGVTYNLASDSFIPESNRNSLHAPGGLANFYVNSTYIAEYDYEDDRILFFAARCRRTGGTPLGQADSYSGSLMISVDSELRQQSLMARTFWPGGVSSSNTAYSENWHNMFGIRHYGGSWGNTAYYITNTQFCDGFTQWPGRLSKIYYKGIPYTMIAGVLTYTGSGIVDPASYAGPNPSYIKRTWGNWDTEIGVESYSYPIPESSIPLWNGLSFQFQNTGGYPSSTQFLTDENWSIAYGPGFIKDNMQDATLSYSLFIGDPYAIVDESIPTQTIAAAETATVVVPGCDPSVNKNFRVLDSTSVTLTADAAPVERITSGTPSGMQFRVLSETDATVQLGDGLDGKTLLISYTRVERR